jgi:protease-4
MRRREMRFAWVVLGLAVAFSGPIRFAAGQDAAATKETPSVVAHFHLGGEVTESPVGDPFGLLAGQVTSLKDLVARLDKAGGDAKVKAVVLTFDGMSLGFGQLQEIRQAIGRVQDAGKKVYVHAEGMSTFAYGLLCAGDRLSVAPQSALWLIGFYGESPYLKGLLDKIGVQGDFMHMGDYKSAAEMFTRTEPSKPAEENLNWLYDSWYESLVGMIAKSRDKTPEQVREILDHGPYMAEQAAKMGLIDAVETQDEFLVRMKQDIEAPVKIDNRYGEKSGPQVNFANPLAVFSVLSELFKTPETSHKDAVAVVYVTGAILPGYGQRSLFAAADGAYGGSIRKALQKAANDASVKAVVMRIDSPGGSAEASEVILNATRQVQNKKPLIVSMGDVAGSGGYYIACKADAIFADEATITASIGVVGGKLITSDLWDKLGVNWVGHRRGANADLFSSSRPFDESQRKVLEGYMQKVYDVFKDHVVAGRGDKLRKPIDEMAGGRVYTGKQALDLGLVDRIGGLKEAIDYAAAKASIEDFEVRVIPEPRDFITELLEESSGQGERPTDISLSGGIGSLASHPTLAPLLDLLRRTEPEKARAICLALQRIDLIGREGVVMTMPFDVMIH